MKHAEIMKAIDGTIDWICNVITGKDSGYNARAIISM